MASAAQLPDDVQQWVEGLVHADITVCQRASGGLSRIAYAVDTSADDERDRELFLMLEGADKSGGNVHDAKVLAALGRLGARVPVFLGLHSASHAILMRRLPGTSDFARLDSVGHSSGDAATDKADVGRDLMEQLAYIHGLPLPELDLGADIDHNDYLEEQFAHIERMLEALGGDVFVEWTLRWLEAMRPDESERRCLVHGDIGPGNFVFEGARVTGIVDWEIAHAGDPMEDLAALSIRNLSKPIGHIPELFALYAQSIGRPLDLAAVEYFRIFILVRNSLLIRTKLHSPIPDPEVARQLRVYEAFLIRCATDCLCHRYGLPAMSMHFAGHDIEAPPLTGVFDPAMMKQYLPYFVRRAEALCMERSELMGALAQVRMPPLR